MQARMEGRDRLPGISNYFIGSDPRRWFTRIPQFARVSWALGKSRPVALGRSDPLRDGDWKGSEISVIHAEGVFL